MKLQRSRGLALTVALTAMALSGGASAQEVKTQFRGWIGKDQHGYYLDGSNWHYCFGNQGGGCGTVALTTGRSSCRTTGFSIGAKWAVPTKIGSMEINGGANQSWTACNIRSETVTCNPNVGYKGRAVINFSERWGKVHVVGGDSYYTPYSNCPAGWSVEWMGGQRWRCNYTGGSYDRDGYLPEWRGSSCQYQKI